MARWDAMTYIKVRDEKGRFVGSDTTKPPVEETPFVDLKITNPLVFIKKWWKRVIGNEGIEIKIKIRPITTLLILALILTGSYGLGLITAVLAQVPYIKDIVPTPPPVATPTATPDPWKDTAYQGMLRYSTVTQKYYLTTASAEAITLEVPPPIDLSKLIGKKIFAVGKYNKALMYWLWPMQQA